MFVGGRHEATMFMLRLSSNYTQGHHVLKQYHQRQCRYRIKTDATNLRRVYICSENGCGATITVSDTGTKNQVQVVVERCHRDSSVQSLPHVGKTNDMNLYRYTYIHIF